MVRAVSAAFPIPPGDTRYDPRTGGGVLLDSEVRVNR